MNNWIPLSDEQYRFIWDKFYKDFNFKPISMSWTGSMNPFFTMHIWIKVPQLGGYRSSQTVIITFS